MALNQILSSSIAITSTAIYTKLSQADSITRSYTDAHNILATTIDRFEFLQLIMQQAHPLLAIKNISTVYIPKYSDYKNLLCCVCKITTYINNHALRNWSFSNRETTHIFFLHLDEDNFKSAITKYEMAVLHVTTVAAIYLVLPISGTINQLDLNVL